MKNIIIIYVKICSLAVGLVFIRTELVANELYPALYSGGLPPMLFVEIDQSDSPSLAGVYLNESFPARKAVKLSNRLSENGEEFGKIRIVSHQRYELVVGGKRGAFYIIEMRIRISKETAIGGKLLDDFNLPMENGNFIKTFFLHTVTIFE